MTGVGRGQLAGGLEWTRAAFPWHHRVYFERTGEPSKKIEGHYMKTKVEGLVTLADRKSSDGLCPRWGDCRWVGAPLEQEAWHINHGGTCFSWAAPWWNMFFLSGVILLDCSCALCTLFLGDMRRERKIRDSREKESVIRPFQMLTTTSCPPFQIPPLFLWGSSNTNRALAIKSSWILRSTMVHSFFSFVFFTINNSIDRDISC